MSLAPAPVAYAQEAIATNIEHTVVSGDYLDKIARNHGTTWQRLFNKNTYIENPDKIFVGNKLVIPTADEVLADRLTPPAPVAPAAPVEAPQAPAPVQTPQPAASAPAPVVAAPRASSSGNTYNAGQCTWHVKNKRPDLPNGLGNANQWYSRAQNMGLSVGTEPAAGAAAPRKHGNHVVYVQSVNGDGTITVSEMNYNWVPYDTRTAVKPASDYYYIY